MKTIVRGVCTSAFFVCTCTTYPSYHSTQEAALKRSEYLNGANLSFKIEVSLLQLAGEAALHKDSPKSFMEQQVARLVPELQRSAALHAETDATQHRQLELVRLLHKKTVLSNRTPKFMESSRVAGRSRVVKTMFATWYYRARKHTRSLSI